MRALQLLTACGLVLLSGFSMAAVNAPSLLPAAAPSLQPAMQAALSRSAGNGRFSTLIAAADYYSTLSELGWQALPPGPMLHPGQQHPQIESLRQILTLYGDYRQSNPGPLVRAWLDPVLAEALRQFQRRHGLKPDAVLGPATRRALNVPPELRVHQLLLNHERQLAFRTRLPSYYVQVNLPEFRLRLYDDGKSVLEMKTIVGRQSRSTPTLETEIKSLVVNPAWNIPRSIAFKDILPKWQADADYLKQHNMRIVSGWGGDKAWIDSAQVDPDQLYRGQEYLRLYQLPGRNNALGQIKFLAPNSQAIYLHDTPVKSLFHKSQRAFSSGCVRLENPRLLAQFLLKAQQLKQPLDALLAQPETHRVPLQQPVKLYLTYWTAWLDQQQGVQFREDIYQRDRRQPDALELGELAIDRQE